jgi:hypothetical protein
VSQVPGFCDACEELLWAFRKTCAYVCRQCGKRIHHRCYEYARFTCALDMSLLSVCNIQSHHARFYSD